MSSTIGHVILSVSDFRKSEAFYDPLMLAMGFRIGLRERARDGGVKSYHSGSHTLFLKWKKDRKHRPFSRDVGLDHLAFNVKNKSSVDKLFRLAEAGGCRITVPPKAYPGYSKRYYAFYFRDPDGIPLEIAAY